MNAPTAIKLHKKSQTLEVSFTHSTFTFPAEFLRVLSPSAEVQGHGPGQEKVELNKENVQITRIEPQGNYAIRITFDDGHDTGIFTWEYLFELGTNQESYWQEYQTKAKEKYESQITGTVKWVTPDNA